MLLLIIRRNFSVSLTLIVKHLILRLAMHVIPEWWQIILLLSLYFIVNVLFQGKVLLNLADKIILD